MPSGPSNPDIDDDEIAKLESMALKITDTDSVRWLVVGNTNCSSMACVQKGAVSNHFLEQIVANADIEHQQLATPRTQRGPTDSAPRELRLYKERRDYR